ncbi:MAG: hypothetical protein M3Y70_10715 [Pseudomonadota bacterium]|nr:hypothetical protein [Pseudomonadota bacterium]
MRPKPMRLEKVRPMTRVLAVLAGVAVIGWVLALAGVGAHAGVTDGDVPVQPVVQLQATVASHLAPLAEYTEAASRPVFTRDRRPHAFVLAPGEDRAASAGNGFDYVLNSVLIAPGFLMAIIEPAQGGDSVSVRMGESAEPIPGWRLVDLAPRSAVFDGPGGRRTLDLRTWAGDGEAPPMAAAPPPPPAPSGEAAVETTEAPAPTQVQEQLEQIRKRIEARRAQLRRKDP